MTQLCMQDSIQQLGMVQQGRITQARAHELYGGGRAVHELGVVWRIC